MQQRKRFALGAIGTGIDIGGTGIGHLGQAEPLLLHQTVFALQILTNAILDDPSAQVGNNARAALEDHGRTVGIAGIGGKVVGLKYGDQQLRHDAPVGLAAQRKAGGVHLELLAGIETHVFGVGTATLLEVDVEPVVYLSANSTLQIKQGFAFALIALRLRENVLQNFDAQLLEQRRELSGIFCVVVFGSTPDEAVDAHGANVGRINAAPPEGLDESDPVFQTVIFNEVTVGADDGPQIFAKGDIDRRTIVESANAHGEDVACGLGSLAGKAVDQVGMDGARTEYPASGGGQSQQVGGAPLIDGKKSVENGRNQDGTTGMWLSSGAIGGWIWDLALPRAAVPLTNGFAQSSAHTGCMSELSSQLTKH